jgi:hypothetical protein
MQEHESAIGTLLVPTPPQPIECGNPGKLFQSLRDCSVVAPLATEQVAVDHNALM